MDILNDFYHLRHHDYLFHNLLQHLRDFDDLLYGGIDGDGDLLESFHHFNLFLNEVVDLIDVD